MIKSYDSVSDYRREWLNGCKGASEISNVRWYGDETPAQTLSFLSSGDMRLVPEAERLIASLETTVEVPRAVWHPSPAGAYPVVPDAIRGLPTSMRTRIHEQSEHETITIMVATTSSAGIDAKTLLKRGTAILGLTLALSRIRPISLHVFSMLDGYDDAFGEDVRIVRINTSPLDLATACYVMTSCGFDRRVSHDIAEKQNGYSGGWPKDFKYQDAGQSYIDGLLPRLGLDPRKTLILKPAAITDPMLSDPVSWINSQIKRFTEKEVA